METISLKGLKETEIKNSVNFYPESKHLVEKQEANGTGVSTGNIYVKMSLKISTIN